MITDVNIKIAAIKAYRNETTSSLTQAKEAIEKFGSLEAALKHFNSQQDVKNDKSYFPLLIKTAQGKRILCYHPLNLPSGVPFTVIETKCDIETRYTPAMYPEMQGGNIE